MRISTKTYLLTIVLMGILAVNVYYSLKQLNSLLSEFEYVAKKNIALMDSVLKLRQSQSEKTILFERLLRITEELDYEEINPSRKQHLLDLVKVLQGGLNDLRQNTGENILEIKNLLKDDLSQKQYKDILAQVEKSEVAYEEFLMAMAKAIEEGNFELSMGDISKAQTKEQRLAKQLNEFLESIHELTKQSLTQAALMEKKMSYNMLQIFAAVIIISILIILIIHGLLRLLQTVNKAVRRVGDGDFSVRLDESARNEIGEVNRALNVMAAKLDDARKQLEEKNMELAKQLQITHEQKVDLEKINKELDNFAHTVSHDIRSPLMGIMSYCSILDKQHGHLLDDLGKKCIDRIGYGCKRLNQMIDDLLALTRLARIKNPYEEIDISLVIKDVLDRLEFKIRENHVKISVENNLPVIFCDRIKLGEVFLNLISNAIKFSSKRSVSGALISGQDYPYIQICYRDVGAFHEFMVKDNGIGIAKENHDEVFGIFKRLDTENQYEGTGAGLSIVKTVIDDHEGKIWIESDLGKGAAFYFTIPKQLKHGPS